MNVRFFGGRKSEYVSIPKHNPIGLYFCADTRELFLGDKLLSDGLRVVPTFADLPSISEHKAAEGVIYFVAATKNGYVLPRGGYDWLQVIYAPTSGEGADVDFSNYYTKAEVDEAILKAITNIEIEVDLSKYATKEEVAVIQQQSARNEVKILAIDSELFDIKEQIANIPTVDLTGYATKEEVVAVEAKIPSIEGLATKQELEEAINSIEHPTIDLESYATKEYVDEKVAGIEIPKVPTKVSELDNDTGYITATDIPESELYKVDFNAPDFTAACAAYNEGKVLVLINAAPDVNSYAVMNYVSDKYITFTKFLTSRSEAYGAFNTYYLGVDNTWEVSKEVKLNKVEANVEGEVAGELSTLRVGKEIYSIPSTAGLATEEFVNKKIAEAELADKDIDLDAYYTKTEVDALIPDVDEFATKEALQAVATDVDALAITTAKERYEVIRVPGLEVIHRDDEIRLNTEHVELAPQNVGDGGESNAYYIGIKIYAPEGAERIRQNITSAPGIQKDKEIVPFTATDIDSYGRKYSIIWVKCAVYQNGAWLNYGMNSTSAKCLGYYYSVEWYDNNSNIIENDSIHVVFTNDACHYSAISDAVSRRIIAVEDTIATNITQLTQDIENIENTYVTNETLQNNYVSNTYIVQNYTTTEQLEATYVTNEKVTEVVTNEVNTVVTEQIETKVTEVIQEKVDAGEIEVKADSITYGDF